jgi:hypothetical protein
LLRLAKRICVMMDELVRCGMKMKKYGGGRRQWYDNCGQLVCVFCRVRRCTVWEGVRRVRVICCGTVTNLGFCIQMGVDDGALILLTQICPLLCSIWLRGSHVLNSCCLEVLLLRSTGCSSRLANFFYSCAYDCSIYLNLRGLSSSAVFGLALL